MAFEIRYRLAGSIVVTDAGVWGKGYFIPYQAECSATDETHIVLDNIFRGKQVIALCSRPRPRVYCFANESNCGSTAWTGPEERML